MSPERRAFYEYHSSLMEPWDGPASIAFTDGTRDRRGARPQRPAPVALLRHQGRPRRHGLRGRRARHPARGHRVKERLHPGRIFLVDTAQGRIVDDEEIKRELAAEHPYGEWLDEHLVDIEDLPAGAAPPQPDHETVLQRQQRVRLHARGPADPARADGAQRARSRSARWAPTRRSRCSRTGRGCSTTTSSSSSRRSPTRRSTRSARSW